MVINRVVLPNGRWFSVDDAVFWSENDGLDRLWRTRHDRFVLERRVHSALVDDDDEGIVTDRAFLTDQEAVVWLIQNQHSVPDDLSEFEDDLEI